MISDSLQRGRRGVEGLLSLTKATAAALRPHKFKAYATQSLASQAQINAPFLDPSSPQYQDGLSRLRGFWSLIRPQDWDGLTLEEVGVGSADGTYLIPQYQYDAAVCVGVGKNDRFDRELARRGVSVEQYDPTIDVGPDWEEHNLRYFPIGLRRGSSPWRSMRLPEMIDGHGTRHQCLLKVDIEGDEWDCLFPEIDALRHFCVVVFEVHDVNLRILAPDGERRLGQLSDLVSTHVPVSVHANNWAGGLCLGTVTYPNTLEVTLIRRDLIPSETWPLDVERDCTSRPNNPHLPWAPLRYADLAFI